MSSDNLSFHRGTVKSVPKDLDPERDIEQETVSVHPGSWKEARSGLWHSF